MCKSSRTSSSLSRSNSDLSWIGQGGWSGCLQTALCGIMVETSWSRENTTADNADASSGSLAVKTIYESKKALKDAFIGWATSQRSPYKVARSDASRYEVKCEDESCSFDFKSHRDRSGFHVTQSELAHSKDCPARPRRGRTSHMQQLSSTVLAFAENPTPGMIQRYGTHNHGIQTSYATARRGLIAAKKAFFFNRLIPCDAAAIWHVQAAQSKPASPGDNSGCCPPMCAN